MQFKKLFQPLQIGNLTIKNRIVAAPLGMDYSTNEGFITDTWVNFYEAQAKGGAGLIILGAVAVDYPDGCTTPCGKVISDDKYIPGLKRIVNAIHAHGALAGVQLGHAGRQASKYSTGSPLSASPVRPTVQMMEKEYFMPPNEITKEEMERLVRVFADGARRAKEAGFDMLEFIGSHGYLLSSFISPYLNLRTDEYGGSFENRLRFPMEVVKACRKEVGPEFVLGFRMNSTDFMGEHGITLDDAKKTAQKLVEAGINIISSSAGFKESTDPLRSYIAVVPRGVWTGLTESIKEAVGDIPVITVNRINSPEVAERILEETKIDLIAMGRAIIADPEFPNKAKEGRIYDIRPCVGCRQGCSGLRWTKEAYTTCLVNPTMGKEQELRIEPAPKTKKVLVVGGGPAGLEAARVAALRNHEVTLCEKGNRLGGQMRLITHLTSPREFGEYADYLNYQINKLGVKVELGREVTPQYVKEVKPDVLIIGTGSEETMPAIPGIDKTKLYITSPCKLLENGLVSYDWARIKDNIVVLCSRMCCAAGSWIGCETAETLAQNGKKVTIITGQDDIVTTMPYLFKHFLLKKLAKLDVRILTNAKVKRIEETSVIVKDNGNEYRVVTDSLLVTTQRTSKDLIKDVKEVVPGIYEIGDCDRIGNVLKAVADGYTTALKI
ncbi:FAD-dependent oxidoreductase [Chloroflexota bacterium]